MTLDQPITVASAELSPEFNVFALGTGGVLRAAEQVSKEVAETPELGVATPNAVVFSLIDNSEVSVTVEVWPARPSQMPAAYVGIFEANIAAEDTSLQLVSIMPSPNDLAIQLPKPKLLTVQAFLLTRELRYSPEFDIDINTEEWLLRLW
jgi:hypothetical protein